MPEREIKRNGGDATAPYRSPALQGTVIAVDREFFFELGAFDKALEFWGGENAELSLRVRILHLPFCFHRNECQIQYLN